MPENTIRRLYNEINNKTVSGAQVIIIGFVMMAGGILVAVTGHSERFYYMGGTLILGGVWLMAMPILLVISLRPITNNQ